MGWVGALYSFRFAGALSVSIPERVWGGLEPTPPGVGVAHPCVSIPERVWGGLERNPDHSGGDARGVSIPERVWGGLERGTVRP